MIERGGVGERLLRLRSARHPEMRDKKGERERERERERISIIIRFSEDEQLRN